MNFMSPIISQFQPINTPIDCGNLEEESSSREEVKGGGNEIFHWVFYTLLTMLFLLMMSAKTWGQETPEKSPNIVITSHENPCNNQEFRKLYGRFCKGVFNKEIRCLTKRGKIGVCDQRVLCNAKDETPKILCERYCLNQQNTAAPMAYAHVKCNEQKEKEDLKISILESKKNFRDRSLDISGAGPLSSSYWPLAD